MGSLDTRLKRVEDDPDSDCIEFRGGGRFWYEPQVLYQSFFLYYMSCIGQDYKGEEREPVPPIFEAIAEAADREAAMDKVSPNWRTWRTNHNLKAAINLDVLVEEGRIEPFNWVELIRVAEGVKDED
jgi:hypothetical protein